MHKDPDIELLREIISCSIFDTNEVKEKIATYLEQHGRSVEMLPGSCLYSPGPREDRIVLVAHADTVWKYRKSLPMPTEIDEVDGVWRSKYKRAGIGADDRAGIAMALLLSELGHSVLITDDEEVGMVGARALRHSQHPSFLEMQKHRFFLQLDRRGFGDFKCYDVGTDEFRKYVSEKTGFREPDRSSFTDICALCVDIPGVNVSVGYENEHSPHEELHIKAWQETLAILRTWLTPVDNTAFALPPASASAQTLAHRPPPVYELPALLPAFEDTAPWTTPRSVRLSPTTNINDLFRF